jgi:hypothetical protein
MFENKEEMARLDAQQKELEALQKESMDNLTEAQEIAAMPDGPEKEKRSIAMQAKNIEIVTKFDKVMPREANEPSWLERYNAGLERYKAAIQRSISHQYELLIVDVDGNQLEGVNIEYTLKDGERVVKNGSYITTSDGIFRENLNVTTDTNYSYITTYNKSNFDFKASKDGYYSKSGSMSSDYGSKYSVSQPIEKDTIILIRPIDYFNKDFASSISDIALKEKVLNFIDLVILRSLTTESVLETRSINLITFKSNNYLQFRFKNANVYNSLKLNKYDIGKNLFDDVIRKILSPLNEYIGNSDLFYGYDLIVFGYTKSFAEKDATSELIEYRFLIPVKVVMQYKNKDISGQQVLDESVILMDDERIELKLQ